MGRNERSMLQGLFVVKGINAMMHIGLYLHQELDVYSILSRGNSLPPQASCGSYRPLDHPPEREKQPEEAAMSDTQSYKTVTFSLVDLVSIEFALQERIAHLEARIANGADFDGTISELLEHAQSALAAVETAQ